MFCTMKMPKKSLWVESFTQLCYSAIDFVLEFFDFVHCSPQTIRGDYPPDNGCKWQRYDKMQKYTIPIFRDGL